MWARIEDNNIIEYYDRKKSLVLNNVRYSSQIFTIWTDVQRKELGIVPIVISGSHLNTAIRNDATRIENAITAITTMDQFIALHTSTHNEDFTIDVIAVVQSWTEK